MSWGGKVKKKKKKQCLFWVVRVDCFHKVTDCESETLEYYDAFNMGAGRRKQTYAKECT